MKYFSVLKYFQPWKICQSWNIFCLKIYKSDLLQWIFLHGIFNIGSYCMQLLNLSDFILKDLPYLTLKWRRSKIVRISETRNHFVIQNPPIDDNDDVSFKIIIINIKIILKKLPDLVLMLVHWWYQDRGLMGIPVGVRLWNFSLAVRTNLSIKNI